jgi:hypothetical protein
MPGWLGRAGLTPARYKGERIVATPDRRVNAQAAPSRQENRNPVCSSTVALQRE